MRRLAVRVVALVLLLSGACTTLPASAADRGITHAWPRDAARIEAALADLGLPVGAVDGIWDHDTSRATCVWRELTGRHVLLSWPVVAERRAVKATTTLTVPRYMRIGINIDLQCQAAVWVVQGWDPVVQVETDTVTGETLTAVTQVPIRVVQRVMPVSTGMGGYDTVAGVHQVGWSVDRWWQSTIYVDGRMYRPFFFHRGQALHGSSSDDLVKWYPASHGCVRMLHADIDALWEAGFGRGDTVYIYGTWQG